MKLLILLSCVISTSIAFLPFPFDKLEKLFQKKEQNVCNVCVYSADPGKFKPKCFLCLDAVYTSTLLTCVNGTELPRNVSFSQADCLEQNCAINYPTLKPIGTKEKRSIDDPQSEMNLEHLIFPDDSGPKPMFHSENSVEINGDMYNLIKQVQTVAVETSFVNIIEPDYFGA